MAVLQGGGYIETYLLANEVEAELEYEIIVLLHSEGKMEPELHLGGRKTTNTESAESRGNSHFVPLLLLTNLMSSAPKIAYAIKQQDIDTALFTETWLKNSISDEPINIAGYRELQPHGGGVCFYVKDSEFNVHYCRNCIRES